MFVGQASFGVTRVAPMLSSLTFPSAVRYTATQAAAASLSLPSNVSFVNTTKEAVFAPVLAAPTSALHLPRSRFMLNIHSGFRLLVLHLQRTRQSS